MESQNGTVRDLNLISVNNRDLNEDTNTNRELNQNNTSTSP